MFQGVRFWSLTPPSFFLLNGFSAKFTASRPVNQVEFFKTIPRIIIKVSAIAEAFCLHSSKSQSCTSPIPQLNKKTFLGSQITIPKVTRTILIKGICCKMKSKRAKPTFEITNYTSTLKDKFDWGGLTSNQNHWGRNPFFVISKAIHDRDTGGYPKIESNQRWNLFWDLKITIPHYKKRDLQ